MGAIASLEDLERVLSEIKRVNFTPEQVEVISKNRMVGYKNICYLIMGYTADEVKTGKKKSTPTPTVNTTKPKRKRVLKKVR